MKGLIFLVLVSFCFINPAVCQEKGTGDYIKTKRQEFIQHQDELLDFLLQIPFEQRQYIFPMLSEKKSVPKKIKTHPDILVWKGKRPTRIAKRFQNDPELLEFLPAQFYYFLAPEMWPNEDGEAFEENPNQLFVNLTKNIFDEESTVSSAELIQLKNGLDITYNLLSQEQKKQLENTSEFYLSQAISSLDPTLTEKLKKQGYDSPQTFARTADKIAETYRLYKKGKTPPTSPEQEIVKNYFSLIPFVFDKSGFASLLDTTAYSD